MSCTKRKRAKNDKTTVEKTLVLAFDIERTGGRSKDETIAIGASVVDETGEEMDYLVLRGYFPDLTKFEERCWTSFWSKNKDILKQLEVVASPHDGEGDYEEEHTRWNECSIRHFHEFRIHWEKRAKKLGCKLEIVSDNKCFDGGFINELYGQYLPDVLPLPYTVSEEPQKYQKFRETRSEQRGLLTALDPEGLADLPRGGMAMRIEELYDCGEIKKMKEHDHLPWNDAYTIAREAQILNGIREGRVKLKKKPSVTCYLPQGMSIDEWKEKVKDYVTHPSRDGKESFTVALVRLRVQCALNKFTSVGNPQSNAWAANITDHVDSFKK